MGSQGMESFFGGTAGESFPTSLTHLLGGTGSQEPLPSLIGSDPAHALNIDTLDFRPSQDQSHGMPTTMAFGGLASGAVRAPNALDEVLALNKSLLDAEAIRAAPLQLPNTVLPAQAAGLSAALPFPGMILLDSFHTKDADLQQKHPSLLKPEHKHSKASRRGPMDDMRQLVRILVKLFPQSMIFLKMGEEGGGNRVSETQIREYLYNTLGVECPQPEWGLPQGWGHYIAELFSWGAGKLITQEQAMKCAHRQKGRSWEAVQSEIGALGIFTYAWPLPLTLEGVRRVQASPPAPPQGSMITGYAGPWASAVADAQRQTQSPQKRSPPPAEAVTPKKQCGSSPPLYALALGAPVAAPTQSAAEMTEGERELFMETVADSIIGCLDKAVAALRQADRCVQAAAVKARFTPTDTQTAAMLGSKVQELQDVMAAMQAGWSAAAPLLQVGCAPARSPGDGYPSHAPPLHGASQPPQQAEVRHLKEEGEDAQPGLYSTAKPAAASLGLGEAEPASTAGVEGSGTRAMWDSISDIMASVAHADTKGLGGGAGGGADDAGLHTEGLPDVMPLQLQLPLGGQSASAIADLQALFQRRQQQ